MTASTLDNRAHGAVLGAFLGDALALGVHWEYDPDAITCAHGEVDCFCDPPPMGYHDGKRAGQQTHYGDQTLILLRSIAAEGGFSEQAFLAAWRAFFEAPCCYVDQATHSAMTMFELGVDPPEQAGTEDLGGPVRIGPVCYVYRDDLDAMVEAAKGQTRMSHPSSLALDAAEFLARTVHEAMHGAPPLTAMERAATCAYAAAPVAEWLEEAKDMAEIGVVQAVGDLGRACSVDQALPAVMHILARHGADPRTALSRNVMAGGDSAARGMAVGMVLGAHYGGEGFPAKWVESLEARPEIEALLSRVG